MSTAPSVETTDGPVVGFRTGGVHRFLGVPFASLERRFSAPSPAPKRTEPRRAEAFGPAPLQFPSPYLPDDIRYAEDCLNLNVWTPDLGARLPVLVWVYGGGFEAGANSIAATDGSRLAVAGPMVVVSLNYRVGAFGFSYLAHRGGRLAEASNLGVQDVVAALGWVQANIERFGGDPGAVTVVGESAGAFIGAALAAVPSAAGLFHRLALFSGGASRVVPVETAEQQAESVLRHLGCAGDPERLIAADSRGLLEAQASVVSADIGLRNGTQPRALGIVNDAGTAHGVLSSHPMAAFASGAARHIPLLVSSTQNEIAAFRRADPRTFDPVDRHDLERQAALWGIPPAQIGGLLDLYSADASTPGDLKELLLTDWIYRLPAARLAQVHSDAGGTSHLALVAAAGGQPAPHGCDVPAMFANPAPESRSDEEDWRDHLIAESLTRFVVDGQPGWDHLTSTSPNASAFGVGGADASADYTRILKTWEGIERP